MFTVLGASGYIGGAVVRYLRSRGDDVFTPERDSSLVFERPLGNVIYAIGLTADFRHRPFDTVEAHVTHLAEVLRRATFDSLVYLSSTRVYLGVRDSAFLVDPEDPSDLYNLSKLMGEALCNCVPDARVVRLSNVVGPGNAGSSNFVFALLDEAIAGKIVLQTHPNTTKDYIAIEDVAEMLPRIAVEGRRRLYNLASGRQIPHRTWVENLADLTGCEVELRQDAPRSHFPQIDIAPLVEEFGFAPRDPTDFLRAAVERRSGAPTQE